MNAMEEAREQAQRASRIFVEWDQFICNDWAPVPLEHHRIYLGASRTAYDDCCHRQIADVSASPYPALSVIGPYLRIIQRGRPERFRRDHPDLLNRRPPLYFDLSVRSDDLTYVDLERAYWSIYRRTTLDVEYDGEKAPRQGQIPFVDVEELAQDKLVRNGLLGMMRRQWRRGIDHGDYFTEPIPSSRRRPNLWGLVMDCLEVVAWSARDLNAVYFHTDGAIFAHHDLAEEWISVLSERFGLAATIRAHGPGTVSGLGRFSIGDEHHGPESAAGQVKPANRIDNMLQAPKRLGEELTRWLSSTRSATILATTH